MSLAGDTRSVAPVIGVTLLFGVAVVAFSGYQAFVVPNQNAEIEFNHNQQVRGQLQDLRNAIVSVPGTQSDRSVTVTLGTTYPARIVATNPPSPSGTIRTVGTGDESSNFTLANARATDPETDDFWDGTNQSRNTGRLIYEPTYREFENPGTIVYENTVLSTEFRDANVSMTGQRLVDGKRLTLITLNGSLDRGSSESVSVDIEAVSASSTSIAITNETGENVTVRVASHWSEDQWRTLLEDDEQFTNQGGHVVNVSERPLSDADFDLISIELEGDVTYKLRMAKVGIGGQVTGEPAAYLTEVQGEGASIQKESKTNLVVQVRDEFNNPVTGATVNASIEGGVENGTITPKTTTSDADGEATFEYESDDISGDSSRTFNVNLSIKAEPGSSFDPSTPENVTMNVTVQNTDSSGPEVSDIDTNETSDSDRAVDQGTPLNLTALASNIGRGGTDIIDAEWWSNRTNPGGNKGNGFALSPTDGEFNQPEENINVSVDTSSWDTGWHNLSVRVQDGNGRNGTASYDIEITSPGGGGSSSAQSTTLVSSSKTDNDNDGDDETVLFTLENTGSSGVTIQNLTVDSADNGDVALIGNGTRETGGGPPSYTDDGPELRSDSTDSLLDTSNPFDLGVTQTLDTTSTISAGDSTEYTLAEFRDGANGGGDELDPGTQVTITLGFSDGSEKTVILNL